MSFEALDYIRIFDTDSNATITFFQCTAVCKQVADKARKKGRARTGPRPIMRCVCSALLAVMLVVMACQATGLDNGAALRPPVPHDYMCQYRYISRGDIRIC